MGNIKENWRYQKLECGLSLWNPNFNSHTLSASFAKSTIVAIFDEKKFFFWQLVCDGILNGGLFVAIVDGMQDHQQKMLMSLMTICTSRNSSLFVRFPLHTSTPPTQSFA